MVDPVKVTVENKAGTLVIPAQLRTYIDPSGEFKPVATSGAKPIETQYVKGFKQIPEVGGQAVLGRQGRESTPWLTERNG